MGESLHFDQDNEDNQEDNFHDSVNDVDWVDSSGSGESALEVAEVRALL